MAEREHIKVTPYEMALILLAHEMNNGFRGCEFIQYDSITYPKLNKKSRVTGLPCPFVTVKKFTTANCMLKAIYENCVNNALERAGEDRDFKAQELPWGSWITFEEGKRSRILIEHKGNFYIRATYNNPNEIPEVKYMADGNVVSKSELTEYLPIEKESGDDPKDKVIVRTYNINSMVEIRLNKKIYSIEK
jgi:hypothetical protein